MGNNPELKFPLRGIGSMICESDGMLVCIINCNTETHEDDEKLAAELVRLANLAHEAEAAMALALQGMFHANGCDLNPANANYCECGHNINDHYRESYCLHIENNSYHCMKYKQNDARCSCGTTEAEAAMRAILQKYNSNANEVNHG